MFPIRRLEVAWRNYQRKIEEQKWNAGVKTKSGLFMRREVIKSIIELLCYWQDTDPKRLEKIVRLSGKELKTVEDFAEFLEVLYVGPDDIENGADDFVNNGSIMTEHTIDMVQSAIRDSVDNGEVVSPIPGLTLRQLFES
jgi:hypothetical protein